MNKVKVHEGWFQHGNKKIFRSYDPEHETPLKVVGRGVVDGAPCANTDRPLSDQEKIGYLIQTGRNFTNMSEVQKHMKARDLKFSEKGDETDKAVEEIKSVTGYNPEAEHRKVRAEGTIPGLGGSSEKELRKKLTLPDAQS